MLQLLQQYWFFLKRMNKMKIFLVVLILFIGFILRSHNYSQYPQRGASADEYTYSFLGISLIKQRVPVSWSYFSAYKHKYNLTIRKLYFPIVWPYFDHPPLNGFLIGGWSILNGQDSFQKVDLATIRLVPIFLSMISSILVFLLGLKLYNYKTAVWALLIYSTTTIFVMNGRVVFAENLLTPLFLLSLYLFSLFKKNISLKKAIVFGLISGLSFWTKELGISVFLSLLFLFIWEKVGFKKIFAFTFTSIFFVGLYILYGAYFDFEVFKGIIFIQSQREIGPQTLQLLMSTPVIVNKVYFDGWYFFGFLAMFFAFYDYKKYKNLIVGAFTYFMLLIFSLTKEGEMGWYMIPLFPFMAIFSANILNESLEKKNWFIFIFLLFVGLSQIAFIYENNFGLTSIQFRILLIIVFGPSLILFLFKKENLFRILGNIWFYLFILGNIFLTYNYIHPA